MTNRASKAEWLCATLIDILAVQYVAYLLTFLIGWLVAILFNKNITEEIDVSTIICFLLYATKDLFFNRRSIGKRIVGISIEKEGCALSIWQLLLRDLPFALFFANLFLPYFGLKNLITVNLFVCYFLLELICVNFSGKSIGDNICGSELISQNAEQNNLSEKYDNRTVMIVTCMIVYFLVMHVFSVKFFLDYTQTFEERDSLTGFLSRLKLPYLIGYSAFIYKLFKPKRFKIATIIMLLLVVIMVHNPNVLEGIIIIFVFNLFH